MHVHIGLVELITFIAYYVITKVILLVLNLEARRNGWQTTAAVSGLLS